MSKKELNCWKKNFYEVPYSTRHEIPDQVSSVNGFLTKTIFFFNFKFYDMIMNFVCYNKWFSGLLVAQPIHYVLCCPAIRKKQTDLLDFWQSVKSWNVVDAYEFYQRRLKECQLMSQVRWLWQMVSYYSKWDGNLVYTSSFFVRIESNVAFRIFFRLDFTTIFLRAFKLQLTTEQ